MGLLDSLIGTGTGLSVGTKAPDFTLNDQDGKPVSLSSFRGQKSVVVYFYPKDDTPGCTAEACSFRDQFTEFTDAGAEVIGISSDSEASHKKFAEKYRLPFSLLSDKGGSVRSAYGVPPTFGLLPGRVTFVIDKEGIVKLAFNSQINASKHVAESLAVIKSAR
ncbi:MAG: alkyl hydroperoxide reductase [Myxococcaceae bacterium]|nr:alkyl hydroperoxide reductase [Myxococcaceae bacterium]